MLFSLSPAQHRSQLWPFRTFKYVPVFLVQIFKRKIWLAQLGLDVYPWTNHLQPHTELPHTSTDSRANSLGRAVEVISKERAWSEVWGIGMLNFSATQHMHFFLSHSEKHKCFIENIIKVGFMSSWSGNCIGSCIWFHALIHLSKFIVIFEKKVSPAFSFHIGLYKLYSWSNHSPCSWDMQDTVLDKTNLLKESPFCVFPIVCTKEWRIKVVTDILKQ